MYRRYYLVQNNGERKPLTVGEQIFKEITVYLNSECHVTAESFWYGPQEQINNQHDVLLKRLRRVKRFSNTLSVLVFSRFGHLSQR